MRHAEPVRIDAATAPAPGAQASADPPLTDVGRVNAGRTAAWLARETVDLVVSSPLLRARQTAEPLADALGLGVEIVDGIGEFDARDASYIPFEEMPRDHEKWQAMVDGHWSEIDGWMDPHEFRNQVVGALDGLIAANPGRRVVAFTHGGAINTYLADILGIDRYLWFYPGYASIHRVVASRNGVRSVVSVNETAHLDAGRMAAAASAFDLAERESA